MKYLLTALSIWLMAAGFLLFCGGLMLLPESVWQFIAIPAVILGLAAVLGGILLLRRTIRRARKNDPKRRDRHR